MSQPARNADELPAVGTPVERPVGRLGPKRADAKPRAWFVNEYFAKITLKKVDSWAEFHQKASGGKYYFGTWEQAHEHLVAKADERLKKAKAELPAAQRNIQRVSGLKPPNVNSTAQPAA